MISYMAANWGTNFIVILMQMICTFVFSLVQLFCTTFLNLALLEIDTAFISEFMNRIYIIVGILMLFKFTFSLLTSIVNPDALTDKEKGLGKVVQRTIVSLMMLILVPFIFSKALEWQPQLAMMVPRLIVGAEITGADPTDQENRSLGAQLAADAIRPFISVNRECKAKVDDTRKKDLADKLAQTNNIDATLNLTTERCSPSGEGKNIYAYEFNGVIAAIVGFIMLFVIGGYCIDMAIRFIKLAILQVVAPIPIISYIDPKSEKNGSFGNWIKECTSTYIQLFIKLAIFYFVLEILGSLSSESVSLFKNQENLNAFVFLFIILGAFAFMGKAAGFICNILGIKEPDKSGGMFRGLAGIGAAIGIGAAGVSAAATNYRGTLASQAARGVQQNKGAAIASAILGGGIGMATAGKAVAGAKTGKMGAALSAVNKRNAAYSEAAIGGATFGGKASAYLQRAFTGETSADALQRQHNKAKLKSENAGKLFDYITGEGVKKSSNVSLTSNGSPVTFGRTTFDQSFTYDDFVSARDIARQKGASTFTVGGAVLDTYSSDTTFVDSEIKKTLGDIYYATNSGDEKLKELAISADIDLPASATGFAKSIKGEKDRAEKEMLSISNQLTQAKANSDATKPR